MTRFKTKDSPEVLHELPMEIIPLELMQGGGNRDLDLLESKGILFLEDDISKQSISHTLKKLITLHSDPEFKDTIQIIINSPGGYCDAGWALIDTLGYVKNRVKTIAMGQICSMALSIFIAGDERWMTPNCSAMIHQFLGGGIGNYSDLIAKTKGWDLEMKRQVQHLIKCSNYKSEAQVKKNLLKDYDHYLSPEEMKKHGLCDVIFKPHVRGTRK